MFNSLDIGAGSTLNIINDDGVLLAQKPYLQNDSIGKSFANRPNVMRILREGNGSFDSVSSIDHQQRLYTFSRVGNLPLTVIVALSGNEVFAAWKRTAIVISGATGVLCIGLLWLTWLLCRELRLRHNAEQELAQLAATDALTGVANRRTLDQTLRHEWFRAQRSGKPLSVLMIDADHFKAFNDRHGHQAGDDALRAVAKVIGDNVRRPADLVARYGGEEFSVILAETDSAGAQRIAEHIRCGGGAVAVDGGCRIADDCQYRDQHLDHRELTSAWSSCCLRRTRRCIRRRKVGGIGWWLPMDVCGSGRFAGKLAPTGVRMFRTVGASLLAKDRQQNRGIKKGHPKAAFKN